MALAKALALLGGLAAALGAIAVFRDLGRSSPVYMEPQLMAYPRHWQFISSGWSFLMQCRECGDCFYFWEGHDFCHQLDAELQLLWQAGFVSNEDVS